MSDRGYSKGDRKYDDRSQRQREDKPQAQQGRQDYRDRYMRDTGGSASSCHPSMRVMQADPLSSCLAGSRDSKRDHPSGSDPQRGYKGQQRPGLPPHGGGRTQTGSQVSSKGHYKQPQPPVTCRSPLCLPLALTYTWMLSLQAGSRQGSGPPKGPTVGGLGRGPGILSGR